MSYKLNKQLIVTHENVTGTFQYGSLSYVFNNTSSAWTSGTRTVEDNIGIINPTNANTASLPTGNYRLDYSASIQVNATGKRSWGLQNPTGSTTATSPATNSNAIVNNASIVRSMVDQTIGSNIYLNIKISFDITFSGSVNLYTILTNQGVLSMPYERFVFTEL
jgi:hypothetical protein